MKILDNKDRETRLKEVEAYFEKYPEQKPASFGRVFSDMNDLELVFISQFLRENYAEHNTYNTLDYILNPTTNNYPQKATDKQMAAAFTALQWVGSPVGFGFLANALNAVKYEIN